MTIQFVGAQSGENGTGSTTVSVNAISGVQANDLIFAIVVANDADTGDISPTAGPSGFSELLYYRPSTTTYPGISLWVKTATASEPGSYQWTLPFSNKHGVSIAAYRNAEIWGSASGLFNTSTLAYINGAINRPLPNMWLVGGGGWVIGGTVSDPGNGNLRTWASSSGGGNNTGKIAVFFGDQVFPSTSGGNQALVANFGSSELQTTIGIWIASTVDSYGSISASGPIATDSIEYYPPINVTDAGQGSSEDLPPTPWRFFHDSFPDDAEWTTFTFDTYQSGSYEGEGYMHLVSGLANGQLQKHRDAEHYMYQNDWIGGPVKYFVTISATGGYANGLYRYPSPSRGGWMERVSGTDLTTRYQVSASGSQDDTGGTTSGHAAVYDLSPDGEGALWYTGSADINNERRISFRRTTADSTIMATAPTTNPFTRTSLDAGYWVAISGASETTRQITFWKATSINSSVSPQTFTQVGSFTTAADKWLLGWNTSELFAISEDIVVTFSLHLSEIEFDPVAGDATVRTYGVGQAYSEVDLYQINTTDFWFVSACRTPIPVFIVRRLYRNSSGEWTIGPECMIWSRTNEFVDWYASWTTSNMSIWGQMYSEKGRTFNDYDHMPIGMRVNTKNFLWSIPLEIAKTYTPALTDGVHYGGVTPYSTTHISAPRASVRDQKTYSTTGTQITYTFPVIDQDCIVLFFANGYPSSSTFSVNNGTWTTLVSKSPSNHVMEARYRIATPSDSLSDVIVTCSSAHFSAHFVVIYGIDLNDPVQRIKENQFSGTLSAITARTEKDSSGTEAITLLGDGSKSPPYTFMASFFTQHNQVSIDNPFSPEYMGVGHLSDVASFAESSFRAKSRIWIGGASTTKRSSSWISTEKTTANVLFDEIAIIFNETITAWSDLSTSWNYTGKVFGPVHPEYYPVGTFPLAGTTTLGGQDYSTIHNLWQYDSVPANSDLQVVFDTIALEAVNSDMEFVWDTDGAVGQEVEVIWHTEGEILSAARSLDIPWNDLTIIGRSREFPWGVLTTVGASLQVVHSVNEFVNASTQFVFNVGGSVAKTLQIVHSIGVFVNATMNLRWQILNEMPPRDISILWHVTIERPQYASLSGGVSSSYGQMAIDVEPRKNRREEQKTVT